MTEARPSAESAWVQLSADLRRFIRRRVADDHTADDLLQETFVRIHRGIAALRSPDRLTAWVYRVARNVILDHYRRGSAHAEPLPEELPGDPGGASCVRGRAGEWMDELIDQLPERYREAVRLAELEGLTQQEVADRLGLSLSGAKSRVQRGRKLLRGELERCCTFEFDRRGRLRDIDPRPDRTVCRNCGEPGGEASCGPTS